MTTPRPRSRSRAILSALLGVAALVGLLSWEVSRTLPVRRALDAYNRLIAAAHAGDLPAVSRLCTDRYRSLRPPSLAPEGGVIGLPNGLPHKNFRAWRHGPDVLICPTGRDHPGPVYRFVPSGPTWLFDGPIGLLYPDGHLIEQALDGPADAG